MALPSLDKEFYTIRPGRVVVDVLRAYVLIVLAIGAALTWQTPLVWVAAILAIGCQQYALQIILHDGLHGRLMPTKRATDLFCRVVLCYPLFSVLPAFRKKHLDHHQFLGTERDPDRYYHATLGKHTRFLFVLYLTAISSVLATVLRAKTKAEQEQSSANKRFNVVDTTLLVLVQAIICAVLSYLGPWYSYPLLWVASFSFGVFILQNIRSFAEHAQPEADEEADGHRDITYRSSRLERIFISPSNMNYHAEHHMYPGVSYYHLPALRSHLEEAGLMDEVEYRRSYLGFVLRYWLALPIDVELGPQNAAVGTPVASSR